MAVPENPVQSDVSDAAVVLAAGLTGRYQDMAIGRARMLLYTALNELDSAQVDLIAQACFIIMKQKRFAKKTEMELEMRDMDRVSHLQQLATSLDNLVVFAEKEDDFLLAAKLDEVRIRFADRYMPDAK